jgi:hypothetical protein
MYQRDDVPRRAGRREALLEDPPKLSTRRWVIQVDAVDCCMKCIRRGTSRWGKHPHNKPQKQDPERKTTCRKPQNRAE